MGERRLTEARRTVKQNVIDGFAAFARSLKEDLQIIDDTMLPDKVIPDGWSKRRFEFSFANFRRR